METKERLRDLALSIGADVCGFTSIDHLTNTPKGFRTTDIYIKIANLYMY
jgi:4-diphosphocytidyl-2C-methyl-D-erythritol kinase